MDIDEANAVFLSGNAAALLSWPSFFRTVGDDPGQSKIVGKWAVGSFPGPGFPLLSCWNHFISKTTKNPDVAWAWIKAYSTAKNGSDFMGKFGVGSPYSATYADPELIKAHAYDYPQCGKNVAKAKPFPGPFAVWEILYRNIGDFLSGAASANEVIDRWHSAWSKYPVPAALVDSAIEMGLKATS
jgi:ABC-type glycerol-3-phosphate transport system substrate-binding protein